MAKETATANDNHAFEIEESTMDRAQPLPAATPNEINNNLEDKNVKESSKAS